MKREMKNNAALDFPGFSGQLNVVLQPLQTPLD